MLVDIKNENCHFFQLLQFPKSVCMCLQSATVAENKILKMTSCSHLELFFHEFITVQITQMKFGTDLYIIVIKGCAFGLICNYLENQHIQYGAWQPS